MHEPKPPDLVWFGFSFNYNANQTRLYRYTLHGSMVDYLLTFRNKMIKIEQRRTTKTTSNK